MTSQTLSSRPLPRPSASRRNFLARIAQWLIEADARSRDHRRLENLSDRLRADAGLPPRSDGGRDVLALFVMTSLPR